MTIRRNLGWQSLSLVLGVAALFGGQTATVRGADQPVTLDGWAGIGTLVPGAGLSGDIVRLIAEARWSADASRDPLRYEIRSTYPDGHSETHHFPNEEPPGRSRFVVYLPIDSVRNLPTDQVRVEIAVVEAATGNILSNPLVATITEFPRFKGDPSAIDNKPFGWGDPLTVGPESAASLPNLSPDGLRFIRIPGAGLEAPGFFLARTEATVGEVSSRLPDYNPKAGRSDEFTLDASDQPAVAINPERALAYVKAMGANDPTGLSYRLPTVAEWTRAALGGKSTPFWWGDEGTYPAGANFLGDEPALAGDTTAPSSPDFEGPARFNPNPFDLYHTFGNVAEWAGSPDGGFARMGGHFRTEPISPLPEITVTKADEIGTDSFVGVRPAFDLTPPVVEAIVTKRFAANPKLAKIKASFNPDRSTVTLTGDLDDASTRRQADQLLEGIWFLAAVDNQIVTPRPFPGQLGTLSISGEPARVNAVLDRNFVDAPVSVRWFDPLPVIGSHWWVNIYLPNGEHLFHKLTETEAGRYSRALISVDRSRLRVDQLNDATPFSVAISLGEPAPTTDDPHIVTNVLPVKPVIKPHVFR